MTMVKLFFPKMFFLPFLLYLDSDCWREKGKAGESEGEREGQKEGEGMTCSRDYQPDTWYILYQVNYPVAPYICFVIKTCTSLTFCNGYVFHASFSCDPHTLF